MSKQSIKTTINANIKQNGVQAITGQILNSVLNQMVDDYAEESTTKGQIAEINGHIGKGRVVTDVVNNTLVWMRSGTIQSTSPSDYNIGVYSLKAGKHYVFTPTGATYPLSSQDFAIIALVGSETLSVGDTYTPIVTSDNIVKTEYIPTQDCYLAVQTRYLSSPLYSVEEMDFISYDMVDGKLAKTQYDNPEDIEIIPVEGKIEDVFAIDGVYTQYNAGQTYRNKSSMPIIFNKIRHRLIASSSSDIIRVFKVDASLWNGNGYDSVNYSNTAFTKIHESAYGDTQVGFKDIVLDGNVELAYNESIFVVVFGSAKTSVGLTSTYTSGDRQFGYPSVFCLSQDISGTSANIYYGWNEYFGYPLILAKVNPYYLKKTAKGLEDEVSEMRVDLFSSPKISGEFERSSGMQMLLQGLSVKKNVPYHLKLDAFGGAGLIQIQFNYNDGQGYDVVYENESFDGYDGTFAPSRSTDNGYFLIYNPASAGWQKFTIEFSREGSVSLVDSLKNSNIREVVSVRSSDTELQVFTKMYQAFAKGNCDIFFECSTYVFKEIYTYMKNTLGWTWTMGLPVGNGCRYYFNGSTLISNAPTGTYTDSRNILDCKAIGTDYEIHDVTLINNGGTYCVHDEASGDTRSYRHLYHNVIFDNNGATSSWGCGLGYHAVIEFDGCVFLSSIAGSVHGPNPNAGSVDFTIVVKDTYFADYTIGLTSLLDKTRDNLKIIFCNNSYKHLHNPDFNEVIIFNNEVRS